MGPVKGKLDVPRRGHPPIYSAYLSAACLAMSLVFVFMSGGVWAVDGGMLPFVR